MVMIRFLRSTQHPVRKIILCVGLAFALAQIVSVSTAAAEDDAMRSAESAPVLEYSNDDGPAADSRPLEPRYQPREPEETSWYNNSYIFGMTRGVADSTIAPVGKAPLFLLTVPLDIVLLPFTIIGGLFG